MMSLHVSDISVMRKQASWSVESVDPAVMREIEAVCVLAALQIVHREPGE